MNKVIGPEISGGKKYQGRKFYENFGKSQNLNCIFLSRFLILSRFCCIKLGLYKEALSVKFIMACDVSECY